MSINDTRALRLPLVPLGLSLGAFFAVSLLGCILLRDHRARRHDASTLAAILSRLRVVDGPQCHHRAHLDLGLWLVDGAGLRLAVQLLCCPQRIEGSDYRWSFRTWPIRAALQPAQRIRRCPCAKTALAQRARPRRSRRAHARSLATKVLRLRPNNRWNRYAVAFRHLGVSARRPGAVDPVLRHVAEACQRHAGTSSKPACLRC